MSRGFASYILAHIGLTILGIATILSIVAVCSPHWSEGRVKPGGGEKERLVFMGLWRSCAAFDYEFFFFYKLNSWTHCIHSHGTDSSETSSLFVTVESPSKLGESARAAAATSLLGFLCLVIAVFIGIPYMFFFFRPVGRWLLLGCCIFTLLGVIFHIVGLCVWGVKAYINVGRLWMMQPFYWRVQDFYWGWSFILAIVATILAFISLVLLIVAFILHNPSDIFRMKRGRVYTEKKMVNGKVYEESRITSSDIRY